MAVWGFDRDVVRAGVAAGLEGLEATLHPLERLLETPCDSSLLDEVGTCLHRVDQTTATVGLRDVSRSAREVDEALHTLRRAPRGLSRADVGLLAEAIHALAALLKDVDMRTGRSKAADGRSLDRLRAACA